MTLSYQRKPLELLLTDLVDVQDRVFSLLEGRQRPHHTRDLYMLAGVASGLMAKASHDLGASHDAMTQARAAYACADNAGHNGLRAWTRGLQALIAYWAGQFAHSIRYTSLGLEVAGREPGTSAVWLAAGQARAQAALGHFDEADAAVDRADALRESAVLDEIDELGGICTFTRPRQLYYAADALAWAPEESAPRAGHLAADALKAYEEAPISDRAFGDEAGTRCALGISRIRCGEVEGAAEAIAPVLELPRGQRIHGVVTSVEHVRRALAGVTGVGRRGAELSDALHAFTSDRLELPGR